MSENNKKIDFTGLYTEVKELYPSITELTDSEIKNIQTQFSNNQTIERTNNYIDSVICATILVFIFPFIFNKIYSSLSIVTHYLVTNKSTYSEDMVQTMNYSLGIGSFAILFYFFILPLDGRLGLSIVNRTNLDSVNRKQSNFIWSSFISAYISIGLIGFLVYLNFKSTSEFIAQNFMYYLLIPLIIITVILSLIVIIVIVLLPIKKIIDRKAEQISEKRITICMKIMKILKKISLFENFYFLTTKDCEFVLINLNSISSKIKKYPTAVTVIFDNSEIENNFLKASREFEQNIINLINTNESHAETIKSSLVSYLNIFLSGDLSTLPKTEIPLQNDNVKKAKFIHYFILGLYLTLPIIVILILKLIFNISLDDYIQSLVKILYVFWACIGIFSNPFVLNNESKELLKDIIKTLVGKG